MLGVLGLGSLALLGAEGAGPGGGARPGGRRPAPGLPPPLDDYATLQLQTHCDPTPKPGVIAFRDLVLARFEGLSDWGISRDCSIGSTSEHKEGRALDLGVHEPGAAERLLRWLLEPDEYGRPHARLRRAGIMYILYQGHIWRAHRERAWEPFGGDRAHDDHLHLSFSWAGAKGLTSLYQRVAVAA